MKKKWFTRGKDEKYCNNNVKFLGGFWCAGWLFTIGLLKLTFWKAVLALIIWAYYLGNALSQVILH